MMAILLFGPKLVALGILIVQWMSRRPNDDDPGTGSPVPNAPRGPKLGA